MQVKQNIVQEMLQLLPVFSFCGTPGPWESLWSSWIWSSLEWWRSSSCYGSSCATFIFVKSYRHPCLLRLAIMEFENTTSFISSTSIGTRFYTVCLNRTFSSAVPRASFLKLAIHGPQRRATKCLSVCHSMIRIGTVITNFASVVEGEFSVAS